MFRFYYLALIRSLFLFFCISYQVLGESDKKEDDVSSTTSEVEDDSEIGEGFPLTLEYSEELHVFTFNVKEGNFCMIIKGNTAVIVDAGGPGISEYKGIEATFEECLNIGKKGEDAGEDAGEDVGEDAGGHKIKAVIITHADKDHYNFLQYLKNHISEDCFLVIGGSKDDADKVCEGIGFKEVLHQDLSEKTPSFSVSKRQGVITMILPIQIEEKLSRLIPGGEFKFLTSIPTDENTMDIDKGTVLNNDKSLVFKFTYEGNSILFTGDATEKTYYACLPKYGLNKGQLLVKRKNKDILHNVNLFMIPHHGGSASGEQTRADIIMKYNPVYC